LSESRLRLAAWCLLLVHVVIGGTALAHSGEPLPDFRRYYEIATAEGRPYIDYEVEHPPGTLLVFKALAAMSNSRHQFAFGLVLLNLAADLAVMAGLGIGWGTGPVVFYLAVIWPMLLIVLDRVDLLPTACATVGAACWQRKRPMAGGLAFALGTSFKLWPLPLAMLFLGEADRGRRWAGLSALALGCAALAAAWWWMAGVAGLWQVLTFREAHGWQIESVIGSVVRLFGDATLRLESGSWRIREIPPWFGILLFAVAAPLAVTAASAGGRAGRVGCAWIGSIGALLLCSALFSAQYIVWLAPAAAIAWTEGDAWPAGLVAVTVWMTGVFMRTYTAVLAGALPAELLIVARNTVLLIAWVTAARRLTRRHRSSVAGHESPYGVGSSITAPSSDTGA
jgi:hypothetical protein